jgi:mannosyltransferase OCH1-like enzyme
MKALMSLWDHIRYRAIKIYANASKTVFSLHLDLFPSMRKELPAFEPASRPAPAPRRIPRIIWQTNYTRSVTLQVYACFRFNRRLSRTHEYRFHDDEACDRFVRETYPGEIWEAYKRLQIGAARADFWRILVLLKFGGLYLDIDSNFSDFPDRFIEDDAEHMFLVMKNGEITNYFLASAPGNPVFQEICDRIVKNINEGVLPGVFEMTGPVVVDAVVKDLGVKYVTYKKACVQGQFTNKKGQYADKPEGVWTIAQKLMPVLARRDAEKAPAVPGDPDEGR